MRDLPVVWRTATRTASLGIMFSMPMSLASFVRSLRGRLLRWRFPSTSRSFGPGGEDTRRAVAAAFLRGEGIEIGALHHPLIVPRNVKVKYVDRMKVADLRRHYPELVNQPLVETEIVDDGETLGTLADQTQDFVIANHFLEHCQN